MVAEVVVEVVLEEAGEEAEEVFTFFIDRRF